MPNALDALESEISSTSGRDSQQGKTATVEGILAQAESAGYPQAALESLRSHADLLRRTARIAQIDVDAEARAVYAHLSDFRLARAARERELAEKGNPAERESRLNHAARLERQAQNLAAPSAEERLKARALATELSIRLAARLRNIEVSTPDVEPASLRLFERTFQAHTQGVESTTGASRAEAQHAARLAFLQAMMETETSPDDPSGLRAAIVQYRRNTTRDYGTEPGHRHDLSASDKEIPERNEPQAPDTLSLLQSRLEDGQSAELARLSRALNLAAAAELNPRHYAVYMVLAENTHLFDWRLNPDGRLIFQKREGAEKGENIGAQVMRDVGGYSGRGAAYRAMHETLDRLGEALQKYGREVTIKDIPPEKRTLAMDRLTASREQTLEAARSQRPPRGKGNPEPVKEVTELE
ncbi:MAG: hypothetical protein ACYCSH_10260 [Acidithiobacillus sp.]